MATSTLNNAAAGAFTASVTETQQIALSNTPADFGTANTLAMQAGVAWASSNVDDQMTLNIRIVNGGTILAAADSGGTFETLEPTWTLTASGTTNAVSFTYVNLTADKATWDAAVVEIQQVYFIEMKDDGGNVSSVGAITYDLDYDIAVASDDLLADDLNITTEVSRPSISQTHNLAADNLNTVTEFSRPALGQIHALAADDLNVTTEVARPSLSESHILTADDLNVVTEVSRPAIGQTHNLLADDLQSLVEVSTPALGQVHALQADDLNIANEFTRPTLAESGGEDVLTADDLNVVTEISTPALGQVHALTANSLNNVVEFSRPRLNPPVGSVIAKINGVNTGSIMYVG